MKKIIVIAAAAAALVSCGTVKKAAETFPAVKQDGRTAIVAHRGFWNCEEAGYTQNSIASLRCAQEAGLWGSEFDIHLTQDNQIIVNHDPSIDGKRIDSYPLSTFKAMTLKNGEHPSTLDEYLTQGEKSRTMLVCEIKAQKGEGREDILLDKTVECLKAHGLFTPKRVVFISFSKHVCDRIAAEYPEFVNQYLSGDIAPSELAGQGINGIDYEEGVFGKTPQWCADAHAAGMSVNAWTVNKEDVMKSLISLGVDQITTNEPLLLRSTLGSKERKAGK